MMWRRNLKTFVVIAVIVLIMYKFLVEFSQVDFERHIQNIGQGNLIQMTTSKLASNLPDDSEGKVIRSYCDIYDIDGENKHEFKCILMKSNPPVPVCIYDIFQDMYISDNLDAAGVWEEYIVSEVGDVLRRDPDLGVIDVGANIGVYSLFAAKLGRQVVAVEPFMENILRLQKAAQLAGLTNKITVIHNAIADVRTGARIIRSSDNQGDTRIVLGAGGNCIGDCAATVSTIYLDDLLEVISFKKAIIKIDIQGYEHQAFRRAEELLDGVDIKYIFMEWLVMKELYHSQSKRDKQMVEDMIKLLIQRDFRPYLLEVHGGHELEVSDWAKWPVDVVWRRLPNKKEYSKLLQNHFKNWP